MADRRSSLYRDDRELVITRCPLCEGDIAARVVREWTFAIEGEVPNQNKFKGQNRFAYAKIRDQWADILAVAKMRHRIPDAIGFRRAIFERIIGAGRQEWDLENMIGGLKPVLDSMQRPNANRPNRAGLIIDDKPELFCGYYRQTKQRPRPPRDWLRITLQEIER